MNRIDFRSDTVSWPTEEMRLAIARAEVGDDVYGEDPTVNELELRAAQLVGKEAALFVNSGTMGNLIAIMVHCGRADEAILGIDSHIFSWENGSIAALAGVMSYPLSTDADGRMEIAAIEGAIRGRDIHHPRTRLILVENSYGARNGNPIGVDYFKQIRTVADAHQLQVHMDGARLFNAAVALNLSAAELTADVDSVSFCLSKGLCAPVGSILCGDTLFINRARKVRKSLGGGMRQVGILAAAGLIALDKMIDRLSDDHTNAAFLAKELAKINGVVLGETPVKTNIVYFHFTKPVADLVATRLQEVGIWIGVESADSCRMVTHYWVGEEEIRFFLEQMKLIVNELR